VAANSRCTLTAPSGVTTGPSVMVANDTQRTASFQIAGDGHNIAAAPILTSPAITPAAPYFLAAPALTPGGTSIGVVLRSSESGTASCLALLPSQGDPTSFATGINASISTPGADLVLNITGLASRTVYDVFCYLEHLGVPVTDANMLGSKNTTTTLATCARGVLVAFILNGASGTPNETTIQQGGGILQVELLCETWHQAADFSQLWSNLSSSISSTQTAWHSRLQPPTPTTQSCVDGQCSVVRFKLPAAPGYAIAVPETLTLTVDGSLLAPTGKTNSQQTLLAEPLVVGIASGFMRLLPESTFPNRLPGGAAVMRNGSTTLLFAAVFDFFVQPVPASCLAGLSSNEYMHGDPREGAGWDAHRPNLTAADVTLLQGMGLGGCDESEPSTCALMQIQVPAMPEYVVASTEVVTIGIPPSCVGSGASGFGYKAVAQLAITSSQACPTGESSSECSGHGTCVQDGIYCNCYNGWGGIACEVSCVDKQCAAIPCATCNADHNGGSWYAGYTLPT